MARPTCWADPRPALAAGLLLWTATAQGQDTAHIALDVGHYRDKPGTLSARGKPEFEFNAELARTLHDTLAEQHIASLLIGADGKAADLAARTQQAAAANATFLLSIHHDSAQPRYFSSWNWQGNLQPYSDAFSGYSLFVSRKNAHIGQSLRCAREMGLALQRIGLRPAPHHAEPIPGENRAWADEAAGVYYYDELIVLRSASMPAVLLEAGVIVNRDEELRVQQPDYRRQLAAAVMHGLATCKAVDLPIR